MTLPAHDSLITALAISIVNGYVASASHDKFVKLCKWPWPGCKTMLYNTSFF